MEIPSRAIGVIYKITSPSHRVYIGKSTKLKSRLYAYDKAKCKSQKMLYRSIIKYGFRNHSFEIIDVGMTNQELNILEVYYIAKYDSYNNGMNLTLGGDGGAGYRHTDESIEKIRAATSGENHWLYGGQHTGSSLRKMSETKKGMYSGSKNPMYGVTGKNAPSYNHKTYKFIHDEHGEYEGTLYDMRMKYGVIHSHILKVSNGKRKTHKGWRKP